MVNPTYDFSNKVALVTGASSGMGLATARQFALAGASVLLADVNERALDLATGELAAAGFKVASIECDVADEGQVERMVTSAVERFGGLDFAFNNAGVINSPHEVADESADDYDRVTSINARGIWACMKHELRQMRTQGSGSIVNCSSLAGLVGGAGRATYHASKHAVIGLTKSAAVEYAPMGIRVNAICPGTIETKMVADMVSSGELDMSQAVSAMPIGRVGLPEEIASAVLWLSSPGASFVVGVALPVDGGFVAQ